MVGSFPLQMVGSCWAVAALSEQLWLDVWPRRTCISTWERVPAPPVKPAGPPDLLAFSLCISAYREGDLGGGRAPREASGRSLVPEAPNPSPLSSRWDPGFCPGPWGALYVPGGICYGFSFAAGF